MKVIDLLNKIANGEEAPKKIKYPIGDCEEFYLVGLYERLFDEDIILNDEIEIIEEEKKMPEKLTGLALTYNNKILVDKINEIIDYIKSKEE